MRNQLRLCSKLAAAVLVVAVAFPCASQASDQDLIPSQLAKEQKENLRRFLREHEKPDRYLPADAKVVDAQAAEVDNGNKPKLDKTVKQYIAQIESHRPVPGQQSVKRVDIYYYRPNPEKGKAGITVKYTVDVSTGKQVGQTEVLVKRHTPISHEELDEAVELAREKSALIGDLYKARDKKAVHWEYLQMKINRKSENYEPGDRVVRLVFTVPEVKDQPPVDPLRVIVNLTKGVVVKDER